MNRTTDYHCHILPGIDDGPATADESLALAGALAEAGFTTVCCTPHHIKGLYDTTPDEVRAGTRQLQEALVQTGIPLTLVPGLEYYADEFLPDLLAAPLLLPGDLLLVELPPRAERHLVAETLYGVVRRGITPLVAHPERCPLLADDGTAPQRRGIFSLFRSEPATAQRSLLQTLAGMGCAFQGNLGSFAGLYGDRVRQQARKFQAAGLYRCYGSDLHAIRHKWILNVSPE